MILVDTSAWIDFFNGRRTWISEQISTELVSGSPAICGPIWLELIRGFRDKKNIKKIEQLFGACTWLREPDDFWKEAGDLGRHVSNKGFVAGSMDLLIAVHALAHQVPLLTTDKAFEKMIDIGIPLAVVRPF